MQLRCVLPIEDCEKSAVEVHQAACRTDSEITICGVRKRLYGLLGKSFNSLPTPARVAVECLRP